MKHVEEFISQNKSKSTAKTKSTLKRREKRHRKEVTQGRTYFCEQKKCNVVNSGIKKKECNNNLLRFFPQARFAFITIVFYWFWV